MAAIAGVGLGILREMASRFVTLATVVAMSLTVVPVPVSAQAGSTVPLSFQVVVTGPTEVCRDTEVTYDVKVVSVVGQAAGTPTQSNFGTGGLQLLGGFQLTGSVRGGGTTGVQTSISGSSLPARFPSEGRYTIFVEASSPLGYPIGQGFIVVNVIRCEYNVTMLGVWILNDGFRPWMVGVVDDHYLLRQPNGEYTATVIMKTSALPRLSIGCRVEFEVGDFFFRLMGQLPPAPADFVLDVGDGVGVMQLHDATAGVGCPYVDPGQSRPDPVRTDAFQVTFMREGDAKFVPLTMDAYIDAPGRMAVILRKVP